MEQRFDEFICGLTKLQVVNVATHNFGLYVEIITFAS